MHICSAGSRKTLGLWPVQLLCPFIKSMTVSLTGLSTGDFHTLRVLSSGVLAGILSLIAAGGGGGKYSGFGSDDLYGKGQTGPASSGSDSESDGDGGPLQLPPVCLRGRARV